MSLDLQNTDNGGLLKWVQPAAENSAIIKALGSPLVNQVSPEEVFKVLNICIAKSYIDTGFKAPDASNTAEAMIYSQMVNDLVHYVRTYAATYRLKELPIAIERGTQKEYGDYFGLNKVSFVQFIKGYKASEARQQALVNHIKSLTEDTKPPTIEQQFTTELETAIETFNLYQAGDMLKFDTRGAHVYDFINSLGLINYTNEQKIEIFSQATSKVIAEKEKERYGSDLMQRKDLARLIEKFKIGPGKGTAERGIIISKAKVITLSKYFDELENNVLCLRELIMDKISVFHENNQQPKQ